MKRLVVIAYSFPPVADAASHRTLGLVRHLPRCGWLPRVITPGRPRSWAIDPALEAGIPAEVAVWRTGTRGCGDHSRCAQVPGTRGRGGAAVLRRLAKQHLLVPDECVGWMPAAVGEGLRALCGHSSPGAAREMAAGSGRETAALLTTSAPASAHLSGWLLKKRTGCLWVADFQDPWVENPFRPPLTPWRRRLERAMEAAVIRTADLVLGTTDAISRRFRERFAELPAERFVTVPVGFDREPFEGIRPPSSSRFTMVHAGAFYGIRRPGPLLEAVGELCQQDADFRRTARLVLLGTEDTGNARDIADLAHRYPLAEVLERRGQVAHREALVAMLGASVLVLVTDPAGGGRDLIPAKLYEYLAAGRPILAITSPEGESGRLVRSLDAGIVAASSDRAAIRRSIQALWGKWRNGELRAGGTPSGIERYDRSRIAADLAGELNRLYERRTGEPTRQRHYSHL